MRESTKSWWKKGRLKITIILVLFFAAAAIAIYYFQYQNSDTFDFDNSESSAVASLSAIRMAERMYKKEFQTYGTLIELENAGFIQDNELVAGKKYNYSYTCVADTFNYTAIATPDNSALDTYRMTQTSILEFKHPGEKEFKPYDN